MPLEGTAITDLAPLAGSGIQALTLLAWRRG